MWIRLFLPSFSAVISCAITCTVTWASIQTAAAEDTMKTATLNGLHYIYAGNIEQQGVLFIHGTPGSASAFDDYLSDAALQDSFFMVSVDRPGWGQSTTLECTACFSEQVDKIAALFEHYTNTNWIIVGHSYGASLAPAFLEQYADKIDAMILLAGSHSAKLGKPRWYNHLAANKLLRLFLSANLKKSNNEIMALQRELKQLSQKTKTIRTWPETLVIQGMKDRLVSPKNVAYVTDHWPETTTSVLTLTKAGHFLPWKQKPLIVEQLRQLANAQLNQDAAF